MFFSNASTINRDYTQKRTLKLIQLLLIFLSLLAILKSIFISFDIDEGYAIAQAYRLIKGDKLFQYMWEPHQLSAFFTAICMLPYLTFTNGDTTGIIIYLRIIGSIIHLGIGIWLYYAARKQFNFNTSLMITLIHINFLPKWVSTPEFEIMHYWAMCILFLGLHTWNINQQKKRYLIISSVALFVAVMSYPTMIILYPVYLTAILYFSKENRHTKWISAFWFTMPTLLLGFGFLGYLFSYMTFTELWENILIIMSDTSHSNSLWYRCKEYGKEILTFSKQLLLYTIISFLISLFIRDVESKTKNNTRQKILQRIPLLLLFTVILLSINQLISSVLGDVNQFYLYFRFLVIVLLGLSCIMITPKIRNAEYIFLGVIPGILSVFASAAITNMTFEIALARIYISVIASCFIIGNLLQTTCAQNVLFKNITYIGTLLFILSLLMCKLLLVRVTGCIPISIKMHMSLVTEGPAAGLLLKEELAECYNENTDLIKAHISGDDRLLYFGCENIYYLISDAELATPSTQGTTVFNEMYLQYFEKYPEKIPTVVIIDKNFETNPDYNYSEQNQIVLDWIMKEYTSGTIIETDQLIILEK